MRQRWALPALVLSLLVLPFTARGQGLGVDFTVTDAVEVRLGYELVVGYAFTVNTPVELVALGVWHPGATMADAAGHDVGLWKSDGTLIKEDRVRADDNVDIGDWKFTSEYLHPIRLEAGEYVVGASMEGENDGGYINYAYSADAPAGWTTHSAITYLGHRFYGYTGQDLHMPDSTLSLDPTVEERYGYFGGNVRLRTPSAVPEPGSLALLLGGLAPLAGALAWRRPRR